MRAASPPRLTLARRCGLELAWLAPLAACAPSPGPTLTPHATLRPTRTEPDDAFGTAVAVTADGSRALVGAIGRDANTGAAHVFVRSGDVWTEEATLVAPNAEPGDNFGYSVALSSDGTRAFVGAPWRDTATGVDAGAVYVFARTGVTWAHEAELLALDAGPDSFFASAVAVSSDGSRAAVAGPENINVGGPGRVRVFVRTGTVWTLEATVFSSSGMPDFGESIAMSGDASRLLVGTEYEDEHGGSARVFSRSGSIWTEEQNLAPLGAEVALSGDGRRALVSGTRLEGTTNYYELRAFGREGAVWTEERKPWGLRPLAMTSDGSRALVAQDLFVHGDSGWGFEVSLLADGGPTALSGDGTTALVGGDGSVQVFHLAP